MNYMSVRKKEAEIQQCIDCANSLLYSDYVKPTLEDLIKSQLSNSYKDIGFSLNELSNKHNLDPKLLKLVLDKLVNDGIVGLHGVLNTDKHIVENRYYGRFKITIPTYF